VDKKDIQDCRQETETLFLTASWPPTRGGRLICCWCYITRLKYTNTENPRWPESDGGRRGDTHQHMNEHSPSTSTSALVRPQRHRLLIYGRLICEPILGYACGILGHHRSISFLMDPYPSHVDAMWCSQNKKTCPVAHVIVPRPEKAK
jgi:hypothetical protein